MHGSIRSNGTSGAGAFWAAAAVLCFLAAPAEADTVYTAFLDGPTAGTPSQGTGTAILILDDAQTEVHYEISYGGLSGTEIYAHIHSGFPGENGPVLWPLPSGSIKTGIWPVGPTEVAMLDRGRVYINIHTDVYTSGEIRGDVTFSAVPAEGASWGGVKALFRR